MDSEKVLEAAERVREAWIVLSEANQELIRTGDAYHEAAKRQQEASKAHRDAQRELDDVIAKGTP